MATWLVPLVVAIVLHEVGHDTTARMLGDNSLAEAGLPRFDPRRYVDPIGTLALPLMLVLLHAPVFGWARSSPTDVSRFRNPRLDTALWSLAGPMTNLFCGTVSVGLLALLAGAANGAELSPAMTFLADNLFNFIQINIFLAVFNMLPIYPFDGAHVLEGLLPPKAANEFRQLAPYGFPLLILMLVVLPSLSPNLDIIGRFVRTLAGAITLGLLGSLDLAG